MSRNRPRPVITELELLTRTGRGLFLHIPQEDLDVIIHPQRQELIVHPDHPYFAQMKVK